MAGSINAIIPPVDQARGTTIALFKNLTAWRPGGLVRNTMHAGGWNLVRIVLQAASLVLMARVLGAEGYGALAGTVALYVTFGQFAGLGSGIALVRHVARDGELHTRLSATQRVYMGTGMALFVLVWPLSILVLGDGLDFATLACLGVAELVIAPAMQPMIYRYLAEERMFLSGTLQTLAPTARFSAVASMWALGLHTVADFAWMYLAWLIMASALAAYLAWPRGRALAHHPSWLAIVREGLPYMVSSAATTAGGELDKTILLRSAGGAVAGQYSAAYRIMQAATLPVNSLILAAAPRMFRAKGQAHNLINSLFIATLFYALVTGLLLAAVSPFAHTVLGDGFDGSEALLRGLCLVVVTNCLRQLVTAQMTTTDMQKIRNLVEITGLFVSIALLLVLIPSHGPWGAIIALGVADTSVILLGLTWISRRANGRTGG